MAKYMKVAKDAQHFIDALFALIPDDKKEEAAIHIARLFNMGIRVSPRPVQGTVRIKAICEACKNLPIECKLEKVDLPPRPGYTMGMSYNALRITSKGGLTIPDPTESPDDE